MPEIKGSINAARFNAERVAHLLVTLGIVPAAIDDRQAVRLAQLLIEGMLSAGILSGVILGE